MDKVYSIKTDKILYNTWVTTGTAEQGGPGGPGPPNNFSVID